MNRDIEFMAAALKEAKKGLTAGGIPIGSVLVKDGEIIGRGYNRRVQENSVIHHAEMNCLENAGRMAAAEYKKCTLYSTLSPCSMCSGAILLYGIPRVVAGENMTFRGPEDYLKTQGVDYTVLNDLNCRKVLQEFIHICPDLWQEDIGV
jgi:cytosine/creatinine deaminase